MESTVELTDDMVTSFTDHKTDVGTSTRPPNVSENQVIPRRTTRQGVTPLYEIANHLL